MKLTYEQSLSMNVFENGKQYSYNSIMKKQQEFYSMIGHRTLLFIVAENNIASLISYVSALKNHVAIALLSPKMSVSNFQILIDEYEPEYLWLSNGFFDKAYTLVWEMKKYRLLRRRDRKQPRMDENLALLLPTSGTVGKQKLVRISYENIRVNTRDIIQFLHIDSTQKTITTLPMNYTYGLSIINTYLSAGASIVLNNKMVIQPEFWDIMQRDHITSLSGVPYTFEMIEKVNPFEKYDLPDLQVMTQAGGALNSKTWQYYIRQVQKHSIRFYVMYGQTEATARMSYLNPKLFSEKIGSIGTAIPNGRFILYDEQGLQITKPYTQGELVYMGKNVSLGYAETQIDLAKGDENLGVLHTGDLAYFDENDLFFLTGRRSRFVKIYGIRIDLDSLQNIFSELYQDNVYCVSEQEEIYCFSEMNQKESFMKSIAEQFGIQQRHLNWIQIDLSLFRNGNGKVSYDKMIREVRLRMNAQKN